MTLADVLVYGGAALLGGVVGVLVYAIILRFQSDRNYE